MINFNDRFVVFVIVMLVVLALFAYLAIFGKVEEETKIKHRKQ